MALRWEHSVKRFGMPWGDQALELNDGVLSVMWKYGFAGITGCAARSRTNIDIKTVQVWRPPDPPRVPPPPRGAARACAACRVSGVAPRAAGTVWWRPRGAAPPLTGRWVVRAVTSAVMSRRHPARPVRARRS